MKYSGPTVIHIFKHILKLLCRKGRYFAQLKYAELKPLEVKLGLMPDHGGVVGLTRLVGPSKASDLILTGRKLDSQEALDMGVVSRISEPGKALDEALELAGDIADNGPEAVRHALKVIRKTPDLSYTDALVMETQEAVDLIMGGECVHGIGAFLSKKKPVFPDPE